MFEKYSKNIWEQSGSILAFPYGWQHPAKTEQWVFEELLKENFKSPYVEYIAFPWATLTDLLNRGQLKEAEIYIQALQKLPIKKSSVRFTVCQHIDLTCVMKFADKLKITDLFWAHKKKDEDVLGGIRLYPLALYPVAFENKVIKEFKPLQARKYLFSFIGAHDPGCYISDIREKIFKIPLSDNIYLKRRARWHFESAVYGYSDMEKFNTGILEKKEKQNLIEYVTLLSDTRFSLCPSGSGPNSIRFWESLVFGCIPVLLSNNFDISPINLKYISLPESDIENIQEILSNINIYNYINDDITHNYAGLFLENVIKFMNDWS